MKDRNFKYDAFKEENREKLTRLWLEQGAYRSTSANRPVRRRPRDPIEVKLLTHLSQLRLEKALADGELVKIAPRRYRLRVFDEG